MKYINMFECQIQGLEDNIKLCDTLYPGWQVSYSQSNGRKAETKLTKQIFQLRVYHDLAPTDPLMENLCRFNTSILILPRFHHFWKSFLARSHFYSEVSFNFNYKLIVDWAANIEASTSATFETFQATRWDQVSQETRCCQGLIILDVQWTLFTSINQYFQEASHNFEQLPFRSETPSNCFQCFGDFSQPSTPRFQFHTFYDSMSWRKFPRWKSSSAGHQDQYSGSKKICQKPVIPESCLFQRPGQLANEERGGSSGGVAPIREKASRHERQPISLARTLLSLELGSVSGSVTDSLSFKYAQSAHFLLPLILIRCCPLLQFP